MVPTTDDYFQLDSRLKRDCYLVGDLTLCRVLLMNDSQYPWLILVPRVPDISEIYQLDKNDQQQLTLEANTLSKAMAKHFGPDKMNVANLGNIVSQLHLHLIARFRTDPAWPAPVWGHSAAIGYDPNQGVKRLREMQALLIQD